MEKNKKKFAEQADSVPEQRQENIPEETISEETASIEQPLTLNLKPDTPEMEVHHHTHPTHGKKNWKSYFWEFLMLFLAVFCGFLAEYKLEHVIENQREKVYIKSMVEDLKKDTANFSGVINNFLNNESHLEIVLHGFEEGRKNYLENWTKEFIYTARMGFADFIYTDRTLQQLKNSGSLRLIRNSNASSGIIEYDAAIKDLNVELSVLSKGQEEYMEAVDKVWSFGKMFKDQGVIKWQRDPVLPVLKNYWTTNDQLAIEYVFNKATNYYYSYTRLRKELINGQKKAAGLITLLNTEYHLK